jgi:hypothetical protein
VGEGVQLNIRSQRYRNIDVPTDFSVPTDSALLFGLCTRGHAELWRVSDKSHVGQSQVRNYCRPGFQSTMYFAVRLP